MDNKHIFLSVIIALLIYVLFKQGCGSSNGPGEVVIKIDTVRYETVYDTTWYDTTKFKYITVNVPMPYYDTTIVYKSIYSANDFDQIMKHPSIYEDSMVKDDTVIIHYKATVRGYLDKMELGYKITKPALVISNTILETEVTKMKKNIGLYIGLDAAANSNGLTHLAPMLELVTHKMTFNTGYDLNDQSYVIGARARISFRKKPRLIPRL